MRFVLLLLAALHFAPAALAQTSSEDQTVMSRALQDMGGYFRSAESHPMLPGSNRGATLHGPTSARISGSGAVIPMCVMTNVYLWYYRRGDGTSQIAPGQTLLDVRQSQVYRLAFAEPGREAATQDVADAACNEHPADRGWFSVTGVQDSDFEAIQKTANASIRLTRALQAGATDVDDLRIAEISGSEQAVAALRGEAVDRIARIEFSNCGENGASCRTAKVRFGECGNVTELTLTLERSRIRGASVQTLGCMY